MIKSFARPLYSVQVPEFSGEIKMLPFNLNNISSLPNIVQDIVTQMIKALPIKEGLAFLTVDAKRVIAGKTQRRPGKHIDGNYLFKESNSGWGHNPPYPQPQGWLVGNGGKTLSDKDHKLSYESETGGMLIVSDYPLCKGWNGVFDGLPRTGGDCSHINTRTRSFMLEPDVVYYGNSQFIHESLPAKISVDRTLIRITLPSDYKQF